MIQRSGTGVFLQGAHQLIAAHVSLVWVPTWEETRLQRLLQQLSETVFPDAVPLFLWSLSSGLRQEGEAPLPHSEDPEVALRAVLKRQEPALFLFADMHRVLDRPVVARLLRDIHRRFDRSYHTLFLAAPALDLPVEMVKQVALLDLPLPGVDDLDALFQQVCQESEEVQIELGDEREALLRGALGLTESEARTAFRKLLLGRERVGPELIPMLFAEKRTLVRKDGVLDYIEPKTRLEDVGGLGHLKQWLSQRRRMFEREAEERNLDMPRGLLVTGISGCGKSFAVKAVASYWRLPLLRLDMNRVYAAKAGTPEETLERAIGTAEAVAPCVLWIDEIETALLGTHGEGAGQATRIFSSFLTWMQEKEAMVFVAATANEIDKLPPEILRKGRFDQVFFVDLPSIVERQEILSVHLRNRGLEPETFDVADLARAASGFSGAELEQLVLQGMYAAYGEQRTMDVHDLYDALGQTVPLSRTMQERIKAIKRWADTRAVRANA